MAIPAILPIANSVDLYFGNTHSGDIFSENMRSRDLHDIDIGRFDSDSDTPDSIFAGPSDPHPAS